jgi:DNA-binding SARP family transcriptional activator/TolB-like protein
MGPLCRVELLGTCRVFHFGLGREIDFRTRKAKCLLGILAVSPSLTLNREQLASFLWDPAPEEQARASLRQCLKEIREILGEDAEKILHSDRLNIGLNQQALTCDAQEFLALNAKGQHDSKAALQASALWKGELFGSALPNAPVFEAWVQVERSRLRTTITTTLTNYLEVQIAANDYSDNHVADELLRIEPSHELAHQCLMRFHAARGDQAAALRQYAMLDRVLAEELDSEPSKQSTDLLVAIKRGDIGVKDTRSEGPAKAIPVKPLRQGPPKITIRPPLTRFKDQSKDYLAEGFADLAKVCLSRFRCWIVIPWPSKGYESETTVDYAELARTIDADFVIDTVFDWRAPAGKLFATLIDCRDGSQVWSKIYQVAESQLQDMGDTVAGAVASNLASQVNHISLLRYARAVPGNAAAYDLWLKGHQLSRLWDASADETAEKLFAQAIDMDPGLACSYASLASILNTRTIVRPGYKEQSKDRDTAFKYAQNAVSLDPFDSRNHINLAWSWLIMRSPERAHSHFRLAVELNPYDSETLIAAALGMALLGHLNEANEWSTLAVQLNPVHPEYFYGYIAGICYLSDNYKGAIATVEKSPDVFPDLLVWSAAAYARLGKQQEAAKAYSEFRKLTASRWEGETPLAEADLMSWLLSSTPFVWEEGKQNFESGVRLARSFNASLPAPPPSGNAA